MAQGTDARKPVGQQIAYLRKRLLGASGAGTFSLGWVPAGANIVRVTGSVRTAFNGTPTGTIGSRAAPANLVAVAATALTTIGHTNHAVTGVGTVPDVDTELVIVIGGTPTLGVSDIQVEFAPPDEVPS
jgi:hypothetical protein